MRYFIVLLVLFIVACNGSDDKTPVDDSLVNADTLTTTVIKKDTFQRIDELVLSIREKIRTGEFSKKTGLPEMVAYYNPDKTIAYIYSNETGEFGRTETESFFQNNDLRYCEYRSYYLLSESDRKKGSLKAEKIYYCPEDTFAKDSLTVFNEDVRFAKKVSYELTKEELPTRIEIAIRMLELKSSFIEQ